MSDLFMYVFFSSFALASPEGERGSVPPENHKNIVFFNNTGQDPLKNHQATKPALYVGPSSARQRNAGGPMMARF